MFFFLHMTKNIILQYARDHNTDRSNCCPFLQADLREEKRQAAWNNQAFSDKVKVYVIRVIINIVVIILLGGSLALIAYTAQTMIKVGYHPL